MSAKRWIADYERGELSVAELIGKLADRLDQVEKKAARLERENERLRARLVQYEPAAAKEKLSDDEASAGRYSADLEKQDAAKRRKPAQKKKRGRKRTALKFEQADRIEKVFPLKAPADQLRFQRRRVAWRLIDRQAVLVGYEIYDAPGHPPPAIEGLPARSEFGIEISVVLAYLIYGMGLSIDKACEMLAFFCELPLLKSQADLLLTRLSRQWQGAFDALCELLVHAAVVYTDETGWKTGKDNCSLWLFASEQVRVFLYGCRKDAATLDSILPPDVFQGCVVSDDAAVYSNRFEQAQKCWSHLIRKALKLSLLYPRRTRYRRLLDGLRKLFHDGKRAAADKRLGDAGRQRRKDALVNELCALLVTYPDTLPDDASPPERDFFNLVCELRRLAVDDELFTFVTEPGVEPTNNLSERELRDSALARNAKRASKYETGTTRRSVIVSVLKSLGQSLQSFTLANVLNEVMDWMASGISRFQTMLVAAQLEAVKLDTS